MLENKTMNNNHQSIYIQKKADFSFSFFREPESRLWSWFHFHKKLPNKLCSKVYSMNFDEWVKIGYPIHWTSEGCQDLGIKNPLNQHEFVARNGIIDVDVLFDFDKIQIELKYLSEKLNKEIKEVRIGSSNVPITNINKIVKEKIKKDFEKDYKIYNSLKNKGRVQKGDKIW